MKKIRLNVWQTEKFSPRKHEFFNLPSGELPVDISQQPDNQADFWIEIWSTTHPGSCHPLVSLSNCADAHQYSWHQLGCEPRRYNLGKIQQKVKAITQAFDLFSTGKGK